MNNSARPARLDANSRREAPSGRQQRGPGHAKKAAVAIGKVIVTIFLIFVIAGCIVAGAMTFYVVKVENPGALDLDNIKLNYTTVFYAKDSKTGKNTAIDRVYTQNRVWVDYDKVPSNLVNAVVSAEDQRFNYHNGVDWKRTVSAFANLFLHFWKTQQGGSTLTQQLVKNMATSDEGRFTLKIREILSAINTERQYSKDQIMQAYVNTVPFGNNCNGVQAAANTYFGKDVSKLNLAECATLAGIIKAPGSFDPFSHPDRALIRRHYVLDWMQKLGYITQAQHDKAYDEKIEYKKQQYIKQKATIHSWFIDQVIVDVVNDLVSHKGYTKSYAQSLVNSQGLQIYTTEDPRIQSIMEKVYLNDSNFKHVSGLAQQPQSAMLIANTKGAIVGIVGGRGKKTGDLLLDRATQSKRQPGSTIKPIGVYGPAMDLNLINWSTMLSDTAPLTVKGRPWPKDDDGWTYQTMPLVQGLAESRNTISVRVMQKLTPLRSFNFLTGQLGFTSLVPGTDATYALAVGAVHYGVTIREMVGGYEIFTNGGKFYKPHTYTLVKDSSGNVLLKNDPAPVQVIKPDTAFVMNQLLQQVHLRSDGTASYLKLKNVPVGCKTGTTTNDHDRWFMGVTPYYIGGVWYGCDQPLDIGYGRNPSLDIWDTVMQQVHSNLPYINFPSPPQGSVVQIGGGWYRTNNAPSWGGGVVQTQGKVSSKPSASKKSTSSKASASKPTSSAPVSVSSRPQVSSAAPISTPSVSSSVSH